ncbi:glycerate kinase [Weizmannia acidilactici]|uniref:Glycerate kinase n=1 Tax=Weizmannia acidilactici TaxID=2607726 RepID=A0A5J4JPY8_9BACI|nr:glycerate kinase [Weizmannia acidilactici]GER67949.1 glycerate kinase [Weizmannia acidilactici]GER71104.1 glycerate kinase [Weizmannia acidilactici]
MSKSKIVIAADSFKGSASSMEVENFIEKGIRRVAVNVEIVKIPIADGGEGTVDSLVSACKGKYVYEKVTGPLGNKVKAKYGMLYGNTAIIEMAEASGLQYVDKTTMNPFKTTTYGTGELIRSALGRGAKTIYVGLGGSATNDGGAGMAEALGVSFKDKKGREIRLGAEGVNEIETIDVSHLDPRFADVEIIGLTDVTNPLCGKNGASFIYGPQKGAKAEDLPMLDGILFRYAEKIKEQLGMDVADAKGAGAAGGLGAGLLAFCGAKLERGIAKVLELVNLEQHVKDADLVITGEGKIDNQSVNGKAPIGVAQLAKKYGIPVIAVAGSADDDLQAVYEHGIDLVIDAVPKPIALNEAIANAEKLITNAGETAYRAFCLAKRAEK